MKKLIALLLAVMMLVSLVACTKAPVDTTTKAPVSGNDATEGKTDATEGGETPAEIVTVKWVTSNDQAVDYATWAQMINEYAGPKIGVNIEMVHVDGDTLKMMYQTGADYDIIFAPAGDFVNNVQLGAAAALEELLPETPGLTDLIPQYVWDAVTIDGHIYGVPAYKDVSHSEYYTWTTRYVEEYYPEYTEVHDLQGVLDAMRTIKDRGLDIGMAYIQKNTGASLPVAFAYDGIPNSDYIGIKYQGGTEFVSIYEQDDVIAELDVMDKLYHEGFINQDCYVLDSVSTDEYLLGNAQGWPTAAWYRFVDEKVSTSQHMFTRFSSDSCRGSIVVINAASQHKLEALKWIELVNTDTWVRDMYWYGVEGKHWEYTTDENGEKRIKKLQAEDGWTYWAYMYGTFFVATPELNGTVWDEVKALNEVALPSPAMGFSYAPSSEMQDLQNTLKAIWDSYSGMIRQGVDVSLRQTALDELYAAGMQTLIDDINAQYKAWQATK